MQIVSLSEPADSLFLEISPHEPNAAVNITDTMINVIFFIILTACFRVILCNRKHSSRAFGVPRRERHVDVSVLSKTPAVCGATLFKKEGKESGTCFALFSKEGGAAGDGCFLKVLPAGRGCF